jgi:hypothetical protein
MSTRLLPLRQASLFLALFTIMSALSSAADAPSPPASARVETLERPDGQRLTGKLTGDAATGFRFARLGSAPAIRLEPGSVVTFDGPGPDPSSGYPPFRIELGLDHRISGRLGSVNEARVQLTDSSAGGPVALTRAGVQAVVQRPGEIQVLQDGFESIDGARWAENGDLDVVDELRVTGERSLRLPAGGSSLTCRLAESIGSGRLEVAFHDDGAVAAGQQCFVDLLFRGSAGSETVRAVLGWAEESLSVESPSGPALAVQRLARKPGWHRLSLRFGPGQTEIAVDGNDLAHGKGPGGPLVEVRLATYSSGKAEAPAHRAGHFDDLRLVRFAEPVGGLEVDATQDELRLAGGDQIFGAIRAADADRITMNVDGRNVTLPWSEVSGLYFRRASAPSPPVAGLLVRLDWRSAPGNDSRDIDQVEGALIGLTDSALTIAVPYVGSLAVPRDRLRRLRVERLGERLVIDSTAHHLGNDIVAAPPALDPPQPEGGVLERSFELAKAPSGPAFLELDVVQVTGEAPGLSYSWQVRQGFLRTNVLINGKAVDYLNRHITSKNETPERLRLAIPPGLLQPGKNRLRFEQVGTENDPNYLDDLGILGIALEIDAEQPPGASPEREKP